MTTSPTIHPSTAHLLQFFSFGHLPEPLRSVSQQFHTLAHALAQDERLSGPELTAGLRKLLEAKDCAVRSVIPAAREAEAEGDPVRGAMLLCHLGKEGDVMTGSIIEAMRGGVRAEDIMERYGDELVERFFSEKDLTLEAIVRDATDVRDMRAAAGHTHPARGYLEVMGLLLSRVEREAREREAAELDGAQEEADDA